ncbi:MAG TPA: porphobilinogen synthase, partial [Bdellovibrionota bacterium]|nr:porphobilinogen synthase [Bdellovibrionota bacterium]
MAKKLGLRRLRQNRHVRDLVREHQPRTEQLIQPCFVVEGISSRQEIPGLTGTWRDTPDSLLKQIEKDLEAGVKKLLLFGVPGEKKLKGFSPDFTAKQIAAIKKRFGQDVFLSVDVCLCSSTSHGQCGILTPEGDHVENGATVAELARAALSFAQAGADCVAPSDMMDGRVGAIREALDQGGLERTLIMSYSAKFHSKFYGPFRVAAGSAPKGQVTLKDRATYQIDPGSPRDALASSLRDAAEGADILMVKPGLPYLDILAKLSRKIPRPWAVYEVSGEFAAIELLASQGLMNGPAAHLEAWTSFIRAGASMVIT